MEILFKVGMALLEWSRAELLQMDMEAMLRHFQKEMYAIHDRDHEALMSAVHQVKYNPRKMKRLEKEYEATRERASQEHEENRRLRSENKLLQDRVNHLELESSSLAGRLIEGQVNLAQEAEDLFVMRRELVALRKHDADLAEQLREAQLRIGELEQVVSRNNTAMSVLYFNVA
jgi:chromosome segregation ATPase